MVVTVPNSGYYDNPYGTTIFQSSSSSNLIPAQLITDCQDLGYTWIRFNCKWSNFETSAGTFVWTVGDDLVAKCNAAKINLLWEIDCNAPPSFRQNQACSATGLLPSASDVAAYATAVSARYNGGAHGLLQAVGIGNEGYDLVQNDSVATTTNGGVAYTYFPCKDPKWYVGVLQSAAPIIRSNIPGVMIGAAAVLGQTYTRASRFIQTLHDNGCFSLIDFLEYHYYKGGGTAPGVATDSDHGGFDDVARFMQQTLIANGHIGFPNWMTECGYPTNTQYSRSSNEVVDFATQEQFEMQEYEWSRKSRRVKKHFRYTLNYNTTAGSATSDGDSLVQGSLDMRTTVPWYAGVKNYIQQYPQWP